MDAEDVDIPSIEMMNMAMRHYRSQVETDSDVNPLQWWTARVYVEFGILVKRYPYTPAATVPCECQYSLGHNCQQDVVGMDTIT